MEPLDVGEAIKRCYVFSDAEDAGLAVLKRAARPVSIAAGATLFAQGDAPDRLYLVITGLVRIWIADPEGRELTLSLMEPGDTFGEIALFDGLPRTASATAIETTDCLAVPSSALNEAMDADPKLARHLVVVLCEILRRNTEALGAFAFLGLRGRLAQKIYDLALSHGELTGSAAVFRRRFSQTDLANMLGVSREAVNKRLAALAHDGLISLEDGQLSVPDLPALAARAQLESGLLSR
ncbi:MAG: Crp/Fnr family transcriptional regulator [Pseudomonadota bacterium]